MSGADILWFAISVGGLLLALAVGAIWLWVRPTRGPRRFLVTVLLVFAAASLYPIPRSIARLMGAGYRPLEKKDVPAGPHVVVLLGSGTHTRRDWDGRATAVLDPISAERTLEAARLYQLISPTWVISSGGIVDPDEDTIPSGEVMRDTLVALGVPRERILVERESRSTRDEAMVVARMMKVLQINRVVLVTSGVHMRRSLGVFRAAGFDAIPAIAKDSTVDTLHWTLVFLPSDKALRLSALVAHELVGTLYYWTRGWYM
jgi:uncharacterized SAM-binding protein YcdF (DUF218 family)